MPLYRDSVNAFTIEYVRDDGTPEDVSSRLFRMEFIQNRVTVTISMGDGISFPDDGTDGSVRYELTKARSNQLCTGAVRVRQFDDSGPEPVLLHEGADTVEGKGFDA